MTDTEIKSGAKVYYNPRHGKKENGIVKSLSDDGTAAFVVFHCNNEWSNYRNYTGQRTELSDLRYGWVDEKGNLLKEFCKQMLEIFDKKPS